MIIIINFFSKKLLTGLCTGSKLLTELYTELKAFSKWEDIDFTIWRSKYASFRA